ncbi:MAG: hypothetical protein KI792_03700 [Alphaproteobacteria bacterium]|nr:hypothetical protein [Alphaproteobacteria bacterium SS10]
MAQGGGNNNQSDPLMGIVMLMGFGLGMLYLLYLYNKDIIHSAVLHLRSIEMWLISTFFWLVGFVWPGLQDEAASMEAYRRAMMAVPPGQYQWSDIANISGYVGPYIAWPSIFIIMFFTWFLMFKHPNSVLRKFYDLGRLIKYQSQKWFAISPIVKNNPLDDKEGAWLEALDPKEWADRHGVQIEDGAPDREAARAALSRQLRRPWTAVSELPPYLQALVAALVLRGNKKGDDCEEILRRLSRGAANFGSAEKALSKDAKLTKMVNKVLRDMKMMAEPTKVARQHAWVETSMAAILDWSRINGGVMASSDFLWLKLEDRAMWYVLNAVGRPTALIESAGAIAHWRAEIVTRRPMPEPDVDEAVFGLEEFIATNHA